MQDTKEEKTRLKVRDASLDDVASISKLVERVYPGMPPYPDAMLRGQINAFPEGVWVATLGEDIVGYCATIRLAEDKALGEHTWREVTGGGYGSTHDATGEYLYGYEVCVDPAMRRYRIGQRFYRERRRLAEFLRLKGIVIAGRIPNYSRQARRFDGPDAYVEAVRNKQVNDPVLGFQIRMGFEPIRVLRDYLPLDRESGGYAVHLLWNNPQYTPPPDATPERPKPTQRAALNRVRVAAVQYKQRRITSFEEFRRRWCSISSTSPRTTAPTS